MPRNAARRLLPVTVLLVLLVPGVARADQGAAVIQDCLNHSHLTRHYSQRAYDEALAELPTDVAEYSDCPNLIRQARLAAASGLSGGGGGNAGGGGGRNGPGAASFTAAERKALAAARVLGGQAVDLGGQVIRPGVVHANVSSAVTSLPTPLLALLIALAVSALSALGAVLRNRVRARRPH